MSNKNMTSTTKTVTVNTYLMRPLVPCTILDWLHCGVFRTSSAAPGNPLPCIQLTQEGPPSWFYPA